LFNEPVFYGCKECSLVFKDPKVWPSREVERARYLEHNNSLENEGYKSFLLNLVDPLAKILNKDAVGLDYGCGPVPALSELIKQQGFECLNYDPFFFNDKKLLQGKYDFVTCCEVVEHFHDPANEFKQLRSLLKKGGVLAISTQMVPKEFVYWWYHKDITHVVFYSAVTFDWIKKYYDFYSESGLTDKLEETSLKFCERDLSKADSIVLLIAS
ncbi:MAG TPA: class I SAM-dependent methyltransferase, partial [bacterium]|nr:class I SAM-dependent methyltransferase [bacterium]